MKQPISRPRVHLLDALREIVEEILFSPSSSGSRALFLVTLLTLSMVFLGMVMTGGEDGESDALTMMVNSSSSADPSGNNGGIDPVVRPVPLVTHVETGEEPVTGQQEVEPETVAALKAEINRLRNELASVREMGISGDESSKEAGTEDARSARDRLFTSIRKLSARGYEALSSEFDQWRDIAEDLSRMGEEGVEIVSFFLRYGTPAERFYAAYLMEILDDERFIPALERALVEKEGEPVLVERMVTHALARIGGERSVQALERALSEGSEWAVRLNAAYGLARLGKRSGIEYLSGAYWKETQASIRMAIFLTMTEVGHPKFVKIFEYWLVSSKEYTIRFAALQGVRKAGQKSSLTVLEKIVADREEDEWLRMEARKAVESIDAS